MLNNFGLVLNSVKESLLKRDFFYLRARMKQKRIVILIIASAICLLALISIQIYWINISIQTQQKKFDQAVMASIKDAIEKLEKEEAITQVTSKLFKDNDFRNEASSDSVYAIEQFPVNDPFLGNSIVKQKGEKGITDDQLRIDFTPSKSLDSAIFIIRKTQKRVLSSDFGNRIVPEDSLLKNRLEKKATLVNEIVNELALISINKDFTERIELSKIDSLIEKQLMKNGIQLAFKADILDAATGLLSNYEGATFSENLKQSDYRTDLFPNDFFIESDQLLLYFPYQNRYILQNSWKVLLTTILLVLFLIGIFYSSLSTIFKQKKLSIVKNDFINNMTHELKTPISTISLACEALSDESIAIENKKRKSYISMIQQENNRLSVMVDSVLKSAVWDSVELKLNPKQVDLHQLLEKVTASFKIQVEKEGGSIQMRLLAENTKLNVDPVHFTNVLFNLLDNAKKYSKEKPEIVVETKNTIDGIQLSCSDNGIGISKYDQKKVFDKFYRVPTGNIHDVKGFGLGLSYVKRIIELHGGKIHLRSTLGMGTSVFIEIPQNI